LLVSNSVRLYGQLQKLHIHFHRYSHPSLFIHRRKIPNFLSNHVSNLFGTEEGEAQPPSLLLPRHCQRPKPHRRQSGGRRLYQLFLHAFRIHSNGRRPIDRGPRTRIQTCGKGPRDIRVCGPTGNGPVNGTELRVHGREIQWQHAELVGAECGVFHREGNANRWRKRAFSVRTWVRSGEDSHV